MCLPACVRVIQVYVEIRRGERIPGLFGPFDQNNGFFLQNIAKSCINPFSWVAKPIKIKMIQV